MVGSTIPEAFVEALLSLRRSPRHRAIEIDEVPPPRRLAPFTAAIALRTLDEESGEPLASGRFVVLHDPAGQIGWKGEFRLIAQLRSTIDPDMGRDPLLAEALWSYADDCLDEAGAGYHDLTGTVTREISESFGGLRLRGSAFAAEIRASWTPDSPDIGAHLVAWEDLMARTSGAAAPRFLEGV